MDPFQAGVALRRLRVRAGLRQADLARAAKVPRGTICDVEHGRLDDLPFSRIVAIAKALGARASVDLWVPGAGIARLLDEGHATLQQHIVRVLESRGWDVVVEASFSIYGERGSIDLLAWHPVHRMLLVVEVKTDLVDVQDTISAVDRKRRLATRIAAERGWTAEHVATWLVFPDVMRLRRKVHKFGALLRTPFPADGRQLAPWLADPAAPIHALSFVELPGSRDSVSTAIRVHRKRDAA